MDSANKIKAALDGAIEFLKLRDEVVAVLMDRLTVVEAGYEIAGHDECAERIILLFAELVNGVPSSSNTEG